VYTDWITPNIFN